MTGWIATSEPHAVAAGHGAFDAGGNAVDAALAAAACLPVVEPTGNGLGGDLFALVWTPEGGLAGLDSAGVSGRGLDPNAWPEGIEALGGGGVTVPGLVAGWGALHEAFGSLPWADLIAPAVALARDGFVVAPTVARAWARAVPRYDAFPEWLRVFRPGGESPAAGQIFANPDLGHTLQVVADQGPGAMYGGPLADRIAASVRAAGGSLSAEDLAAHRSRWVPPLIAPWGSQTVVELPSPTQGIVVLEALGILDGLEGSLHEQIEAIKIAFADGWSRVGHPADSDVAALLDPRLLADRRQRVGSTAARGPTPPMAGHGTVLVCSGDAEGRLATVIQSNFHGFGSGVVVEGTGIALQNRGFGFSPPHPASVNALGPGRQPFHTLIPALILGADGRASTAFGCMGGQMQPQGHLQILAHLRAGASPRRAVSAPRWRWVPAEAGGSPRGSVLLEVGFDPAAAASLVAQGHVVRRDVAPRHFGGAQIVTAQGGVGTDPRKDGANMAS